LVEERHIAWVHLFILLNGAFGPMLHLLSDDLICCQGLEMLNNVYDYFFTNMGDIQAQKFQSNGERRHGYQNFYCNEMGKLDC